jgi:hypothetical protein
MLASISSQHVESDSRLLGNPLRFNQVENRSSQQNVYGAKISRGALQNQELRLRDFSRDKPLSGTIGSA